MTSLNRTSIVEQLGLALVGTESFKACIMESEAYTRQEAQKPGA